MSIKIGQFPETSYQREASRMDRWYKTTLVLSLAALGVIMGGCGSGSVPDGTVVSVLYTSDVRGKLEGCGCRQAGGAIIRRSAE